MASKPTRRERCAAGRHTPMQVASKDLIRRDICRYCGQPIMRTQATRIWFLAGVMA